MSAQLKKRLASPHPGLVSTSFGTSPTLVLCHSHSRVQRPSGQSKLGMMSWNWVVLWCAQQPASGDGDQMSEFEIPELTNCTGLLWKHSIESEPSLQTKNLAAPPWPATAHQFPVTTSPAEYRVDCPRGKESQGLYPGGIVLCKTSWCTMHTLPQCCFWSHCSTFRGAGDSM